MSLAFTCAYAPVMPDASSLAVFAAASVALLLTPGPAVLYIVARSIDQGRAAGMVSVVGVGLGSMVHVIAATVGLSSLLVRSATAYTAVKYVGAAYLVYLGIRGFSGRDDVEVEAAVQTRALSRIFSQGVWVNVLNPKTALFFLAFLPQFADPARGPVAVQILALGVLFVSMGIVSDGLYALAAGRIGAWMKVRPGIVATQRRLAGGIFVSLGIATALATHRTD